MTAAEDDPGDRECVEDEVREWIEHDRLRHKRVNEEVIARHLSELPTIELRSWAEAAHAELYHWLRSSLDASSDDYYAAADDATAAASAYASGDLDALEQFAAKVARIAADYHPDDRPKLPKLSASRGPVTTSVNDTGERLAFCGSPLPPKSRVDAEFCSCRACGAEKKRRQRAARKREQ